ncbi:MAG: enoyl-CoA hydratase-related protein [Planctomycetota bacterium]
MDSTVQYTLDGGVASVTLNRPEKRNALTRALLEQLQRVVDELSQDESLRVLILSSRGPAFCAGMDLGEMQERTQADDPQAEWSRDSQVYAQLLEAIYNLPVPTLASIPGPALAGGMGLMLACDLAIASEEAFFALPEPARGITAAMVSPLLIHRVGYGAARYLLLSGQRVTAQKAMEMGLVHECVSHDELATRTAAITHSILTGAPSAMFLTKKHIDQCAGARMSEQLRQSIEISAKARRTEDAREGLRAFLEKRDPLWKPIA